MTKNVVLLCLDSVRKDYYDEYAPRLQKQAEVSFDQCRAASSWSVPSHGSIFTGKLPSEHGIHAYNRSFSCLTRDQTFLADLPNHKSLGVSANAYASDIFGFDGLFTDFRTITRRLRYPDGINISEFGADYCGKHPLMGYVKASVNHSHPIKSLANGVYFKAMQLNERLPIPKLSDNGASLVAKEVRRQVDETSEPFVQFVNFMDAHGPLHHHLGLDRKFHDAPNSWDSASGVAAWDINKGGDLDDHETSIKYFRGLYAASIDYLDRIVSDLIEELQQETDNETSFIITSDHGENLVYQGDNYLFEHTGSLSEGLLHVPLDIVNPPDNYKHFNTRFVSQLQIGDLITGLVNDKGTNPTREVIGSEIIGGNYFPDTGRREYWDRSIRCAYKGKRKVIWDSLGNTTEYRLSDLPSTQEEVNTDISIPRWALNLFSKDIETVKQEAKQMREETNVSEAVQNRLQNLGYKSP